MHQDNEEDADATRIFMAEERRLFEKMFPARKPASSALSLSRTSLSTSHLNSSRNDPPRSLENIMSNASASSTNAKLFDAIEENRKLRRQLEDERLAVRELKTNEKENSLKMDALIDEVAMLKKQLAHGERTFEDALNDSMSRASDVGAELSVMQRVAEKLFNWRIKDRAQLEILLRIMQREGLWTARIRDEVRDSYKHLEVTDLSETMISELARGSVIDYKGIDEGAVLCETQLEHVFVEPNTAAVADEDLDENDVTTGQRFQGKVVNDTLQLLRNRGSGSRSRSGSGPRRLPSPIPSECSRMENSTFDQTVDVSQASSICDQTVNSVDYENYEKIQKLEAENFQLKQQLFVSKGHSKNALLYREQKIDFENKYNFLNKKFEETMKELCSLRDATARNVFGSEDGRNYVDKMADMHQKTVDLGREIERLKSDVEQSHCLRGAVETNLDNALTTISDLQKEVDGLHEKLNDAETLAGELRIRLTKCDSDNRALQTEVLEKDKIITNLKQAKTAEPTDAGDTTQIFHVRMNPLEQAHEEQRAREEEEERQRKRKLSEDASGDADSEVKRAKMDDRITALEEQLRRTEHSKAKAVEIQTSLARRYREVATALTGYQIKMRDEECHVVSCLGEEPEDAFTFKYEDGQLMLLEDISGASERKWRSEMDRYIGELSSVPAFLSRVTIRLAEQAAADSTYCQPSFSVLQEQ